MSKKRVLVTMMILTPLVLSACSATNNTKVSGNTASTSDQRGGGTNRPDYGQPQTPPDISGIVKSIVGNEVTILKIERGNFNRASSTESGAGKADAPTPSLSMGANPTTSQRGQGMGGGFARGGASSTEDRAQMLARLESMSTGQETVIIPVGSQMLKTDPSSASGKREMVEASIADVINDKMLTIWLDKEISDKKVASFVMIN